MNKEQFEVEENENSKLINLHNILMKNLQVNNDSFKGFEKPQRSAHINVRLKLLSCC